MAIEVTLKAVIGCVPGDREFRNPVVAREYFREIGLPPAPMTEKEFTAAIANYGARRMGADWRGRCPECGNQSMWFFRVFDA